jgi:hypothetical protein
MGAARLALVAIVLVSATAGCSRSQVSRPGTLSRWERQLGLGAQGALARAQPPVESVRRPASAQPACLRDRLGPDGVRAEIGREEAARGGSPVPGDWGGRSLSSLPPPQGRFLAENGKWLPDNASFGSCDDVPCALNSIYGTPDGEEGWLAYGFYLRTGYALACSERIPPNSYFEGKTYSDYLFPKPELTAFWKLSFGLPPSMRQMGSLQTLHRLPKNGVLNEWKEGVCGDATGNKSEGYIRLADGCLSLPQDGEGYKGFFYLGVTHEMGHRLDSWLGTPSHARTDSKEWLDLSGWRMETVTDGSSDGVSTVSWKSDPAREGFMREYSGTNPMEDWADSVAFFRFDPRTALSVAPRKSAYLSANVFGGRVYDTAGLNAYYEDVVTRAASTALPSLVSGCASAAAPGTGASVAATTDGPHLEFTVPLPDAITGCLERGLSDRISGALDDLRGNELEACDILSHLETDLRARIFSRLNPDIAQLVARQGALASLFESSRKLHATIDAELDPREAYLHCYRTAAARDCYQAALSAGFDGAAKLFAAALGDTQIGRERDAYFAANTFEKAGEAVAQFHRQLYAGIGGLVGAAASERWDDCQGVSPAASPSPTAPLTQPFGGGAQYVAREILDCVNTSAYADLRRARDRYLARFELAAASDPDGQAYVDELLLPQYLDGLNARLTESAEAEKAAREKLRDGFVASLAAPLVSDASWLAGAVSRDAAVGACQPAAEARFDAAVASSPGAIPARFSAVEDVRRDWSALACGRAVDDPAVARAISAAADQAVHDWNEATQVLGDFILMRAQDESKSCAGLIAARGPRFVYSKRRHDCLIQAWPHLEQSARETWEKVPVAQKVLSRAAGIQEYLDAHRAQEQATALRKLDSMP